MNERLEAPDDASIDRVNGRAAQGRLQRGSSIPRILAREWLYFLGGLFFNFVVMPWLLLALFYQSGHGLLNDAIDFYARLLGDASGWIFLLGLIPYLLCQLVRSIVWAITTVRSSQRH